MTPMQIENLLVWGEIEDATIVQAARASRLPFVAGHVALMPDAHIGMGATIGSVIPTVGAIVPSAVGSDIGCGMVAQQTGYTASDLPDDLTGLHNAFSRSIPSGVGKGQAEIRLHASTRKFLEVSTQTPEELRIAASQMGTLGSGNHFVELSLDEDDAVWLVLHSGSRGIGNRLAQRHIKCAKSLMKENYVYLEDPDLAYLVEGTGQFASYITDMLWAQEYAARNRAMMMRAALRDLQGAVGFVAKPPGAAINCHHNYSAREIHGGREIWVTRKGAIRAGVGDLGVIPGSMGTSTYIVRGLGSDASYQSASHGAGRLMSRRKAKELLSAESLAEAMRGKTWNDGQSSALVDEHPEAYKPIDEVMAAQADLVEVVHSLTQILNYKGV